MRYTLNGTETSTGQLFCEVALALGLDYRLIIHDEKEHFYLDDVSEFPIEVDFLTGDGMLLLIEQARKAGFIVTLNFQDNEEVCCRFGHYGIHKVVYADEAPIAVLMACLRAKGHDVELTHR